MLYFVNLCVIFLICVILLSYFFYFVATREGTRANGALGRLRDRESSAGPIATSMTHSYIHARTHTYMHALIHTCTHSYAHTHAFTHDCTHAHT